MAAPIVGAPVVTRDGITLHITPPLERVAGKLARLGIRLLNFDGLWDRIERTMQDIQQEQFDTHGHGAWPPLADSTLREKSRLGFPADPLVRTSRLRDAYTNPAVAASRGPRHLIWGGDVDYSRHHQQPAIPGRPPRRKIIDLRVADRRKLERDVVAFMNDAVTREFGRL